MTPEEALKMLDELAAMVQLDRKSHAAVQDAVATLAKALIELRDYQEKKGES